MRPIIFALFILSYGVVFTLAGSSEQNSGPLTSSDSLSGPISFAEGSLQREDSRRTQKRPNDDSLTVPYRLPSAAHIPRPGEEELSSSSASVLHGGYGGEHDSSYQYKVSPRQAQALGRQKKAAALAALAQLPPVPAQSGKEREVALRRIRYYRWKVESLQRALDSPLDAVRHVYSNSGSGELVEDPKRITNREYIQSRLSGAPMWSVSQRSWNEESAGMKDAFLVQRFAGIPAYRRAGILPPGDKYLVYDRSRHRLVPHESGITNAEFRRDYQAKSRQRVRAWRQRVREEKQKVEEEIFNTKQGESIDSDINNKDSHEQQQENWLWPETP